MKIVELKQLNNEKIAEYLKKASNLIRKMFINEIEIDIITFKKMRDRYKKEQINFEYNKDSNYIFVTIEKLVKTIYNEIEKSNPFDSTYRNNIRVMLFEN